MPRKKAKSMNAKDIPEQNEHEQRMEKKVNITTKKPKRTAEKDMTSPAQQRLAAALGELQRLQRDGKKVVRARNLTRMHREALVRSGFLRMVVKGWYVVAHPSDLPGDSTSWWVSRRDFIAGYCDERFGTDWYLAPQQSLAIHAGAMALPKQIIVHVRGGRNHVLALPDGCSLMDYASPDVAAPEQIEVKEGLRVLTLPSALPRTPEAFFRASPMDAQVVLASFTDASDLNRVLLADRHTAAGRLAGAFRAIGRSGIAEDVLRTMRAAGHDVRELNPFDAPVSQVLLSRPASPYVHRVRLMWQQMRDDVLSVFPLEPGLPRDLTAYLRETKDMYQTDAYHSLSIEGYQVTDSLIARVAQGDWDPDQRPGDAGDRDAMAARGYYRAFERVQGSLQQILAGANAGEAARADHGDWYRELWGASVEAGILAAADLAGYRDGPVFIRGAQHVPPSREAVRDLMPVLFDLIADETSAAVRAVLGHFVFVYIHPYMDGNGRIGRFLMNAMLASGGYPWTVIRVERRSAYGEALDRASTHNDIRPFAEFVAAALQGIASR